MNTYQQSQVTAVRAVFQAMFDAVCVAPDFTEDRWTDFIRALDTMGRLLFGYPHLESSESDIFGALDDIAFQLTATKAAIEQTTKEARIVMHDLHEIVGPPDESEAPPAPETEHSAPEPTNSAVPRAEQPSMPEHLPVAMPSAIVETLVRVGREPEELAAQPPRVVKPQVPNSEDEALFAVIRANPEISMAAAERAVDMAPGRGIQRIKLLDGYGTLPADIKEWREARGKTRGVPKGVHSQTVREQINQRQPLSVVDESKSFDERRAESAREASERTWRERHPEEARA